LFKSRKRYAGGENWGWRQERLERSLLPHVFQALEGGVIKSICGKGKKWLQQKNGQAKGNAEKILPGLNRKRD